MKTPLSPTPVFVFEGGDFHWQKGGFNTIHMILIENGSM
jgi:hypothetical protein